jgi:hypothetical protein
LLFDLDAVATEDGDNLNIDLHYVNGMDITNLHTPVYDVQGAGELLGSIEGTQNGRRVNYDIDMSWGVDADVPADGGCGSGTVLVTDRAVHSHRDLQCGLADVRVDVLARRQSDRERIGNGGVRERDLPA